MTDEQDKDALEVLQDLREELDELKGFRDEDLAEIPGEDIMDWDIEEGEEDEADWFENDQDVADAENELEKAAETWEIPIPIRGASEQPNPGPDAETMVIEPLEPVTETMDIEPVPTSTPPNDDGPVIETSAIETVPALTSATNDVPAIETSAIEPVPASTPTTNDAPVIEAPTAPKDKPKKFRPKKSMRLNKGGAFHAQQWAKSHVKEASSPRLNVADVD